MFWRRSENLSETKSMSLFNKFCDSGKHFVRGEHWVGYGSKHAD